MKSATAKPRMRPRMRVTRALVADADAGVREELEDQLRTKDRDVLAVSDGLSAIPLASEPSIVLLVVDLVLPLASGLRVFRSFRQSRGSSVRLAEARKA